MRVNKSLGLCCLLCMVTPLVADVQISFSHRVDDGSGNVTEWTESNSGSVSAGGTTTYSVPSGSYKFSAATDVTFLDLSTEASLDVNVNQLGNAGSSFARTSTASLHARSQLIDTAHVEGPAQGTEGTLIFTWVITGDARALLNTDQASLDPANAVCVNPMFPCNIVRAVDHSVSYELSSPTLAQVAPPFDGIVDGGQTALPGVSGFFPGQEFADEVTDVDEVSASGALIFPVAWQAGVPLAVEFDFDVTLSMDLLVDEAPVYRGLLEGNFFNTATLAAVDVYDESGVLISDAYLASDVGGPARYPTTAAVPEPSAFVLVGLLGMLKLGTTVAARTRAGVASAATIVTR